MLQSDNHGVPGVPQVLFIMDDDDRNKLSAKSVKLGAFPTRAQINVLRQNRSFYGTTKIPNSLEIPKNNFDFKFCISGF